MPEWATRCLDLLAGMACMGSLMVIAMVLGSAIKTRSPAPYSPMRPTQPGGSGEDLAGDEPPAWIATTLKCHDGSFAVCVTNGRRAHWGEWVPSRCEIAWQSSVDGVPEHVLDVALGKLIERAPKAVA